MSMHGCACGIDVHAHFIPHDFPRYIGGALPADWPSMAPAHACHRHVMIAGKVYRTVSEMAWSPTRRIADAPTLDVLLQRFGADALMIGTDYPFAFRDARPVAGIEAAVADPAVRERLVAGNAARFLALEHQGVPA